MDEDTIHRRVRDARVGRLATVTPDGRPHVVPCCFAIDDNVLYSAVDRKPKSTLELQRLANIRAHPSVALLVDQYAEDWQELWWIRVDGVARVIERGDEYEHAIGVLRDKYLQYRSAAPRGAVVVIEPTHWRAWP